MKSGFLVAGCTLAALSVAAGAFGAHALSERITPERLDVFETAVRYQMYHALALLAVAWVSAVRDSVLVRLAGVLFVAGTLIFSGSLYVLVLSGVRWWGAVTPVGGAAFIAGWICLGIAAIRDNGR